MKDHIRKWRQKWIKEALVYSVLFIVILYFAVFSSSESASVFLFFILLLLAGSVIYMIKELIFFDDNFGNPNNHLVHWEYSNGDILVITCWGLLKHNISIPKLSVSTKFEGFEWGLDNAKSLAEKIIKNEGNPLFSLLPSIQFSTTSNQVEDYITFSFVDKVDLTFIDKDPGFLLYTFRKRTPFKSLP